MDGNLKRISRFFPLLGLILVVIGGIYAFTTRRFGLPVNLLLGGGAVAFLLYIALNPEAFRTALGGRQARYGTSTLLSIVLFLAVAVLLYFIAYSNDDWRFDTTEAREFTPLEETAELLDGLTEPVRILAFFTPNEFTQRGRAEQLLENLQSESDLISYEFRDPEAEPILTQRYEVEFSGTLVFIRGEGETETFSKSATLNDTDIHLALVRLLNPTVKKVYFLTGHGEAVLDGPEATDVGQMVGFLRETGFTVAELNLFTEGAVPADANALAVVAPLSPLFPEETAAIQEYVANGGALLVLKDSFDSSGRRLITDASGVDIVLLDAFGVRFRDDLVIDTQLAQAGQGAQVIPTFRFLVNAFGTHPVITDDLEQLGMAFDIAQTVETQPAEAVTQTELAFSSDSAWGETDYDALFQNIALPDGDDAVGPLTLALAAENSASGARLVVAGDSNLIVNQGAAQLGNFLFVSNALNWLVDDELAISLTPRETIQRRVVVPETQFRILWLISVWAGPLLMTGIGVIVWFSRRQRI